MLGVFGFRFLRLKTFDLWNLWMNTFDPRVHAWSFGWGHHGVADVSGENESPGIKVQGFHHIFFQPLARPGE